MAVPVSRFQEVSNDLFVRRGLIGLRRASRESADDCCCDKHTAGGDARTPVHLVGPSLATLTRAQAGLKVAGSSTSSAEASTSSIQSESAANRWAVWRQTGTRNNTFVMPIPRQDSFAQNLQSALSVIAPLPLIPFIQSRVGRGTPSTVDALRTIFQNAVPHSSIQRRSPAPTPDASRRDSIRDTETPSCLLRRADRPDYVLWR